MQDGKQDHIFRTEEAHMRADAPLLPTSSLTDFDKETYRPYLSGIDITDEYASELMRIVWNIMLMSFETNLSADSCEQILEHIFNHDHGDLQQLD